MEISDEVRNAAQHILDTYLPSVQRWTRGHYTAAPRRVCLYEGIDQADCEPWVKWDVKTTVAAVIKEQYPKLPGCSCTCLNNIQISELLSHDSLAHVEGIITSFNDHHSIRYADVRRILEKVIAG